MVDDGLVIRRIDLQLPGSPIADSVRMGLGTLFNNGHATRDGLGRSDLRSSSNVTPRWGTEG